MYGKAFRPKKIKSYIGIACYYIAPHSEQYKLYEGKIIEDLGEKYKCEMYCRNIYEDNTIKHIMILEKKQVKINL